MWFTGKLPVELVADCGCRQLPVEPEAGCASSSQSASGSTGKLPVEPEVDSGCTGKRPVEPVAGCGCRKLPVEPEEDLFCKLPLLVSFQ